MEEESNKEKEKEVEQSKFHSRTAKLRDTEVSLYALKTKPRGPSVLIVSPSGGVDYFQVITLL